MSRFLTILAGAALLFGAAAPARAEAPAKAKPVTVPFELLRSNHMAVQVKVNGQGPYRLIFDTGAPITMVNNKVARAAGLLKGKAKPAFTLFGSMGEVKIKSLEVGGQKAENVAAIVMDHPTVGLLASKLGPIEGIVGFPFFARYRMTIDYQAKTLTFEPNGYDPPDVMKGMVSAVMMLRSNPTKVLAPAGQWGFTAVKEVGDEEPGVTVKAVVPGSAAAQGGLRVGDRVLTLGGRWTDSVQDLFAAAGYAKPGAPVAVKVRRGGTEMGLRITPAAGL
jgi:hypothetical protein